jgi:hypothetical protein
LIGIGNGNGFSPVEAGSGGVENFVTSTDSPLTNGNRYLSRGKKHHLATPGGRSDGRLVLSR